MGGGGLPIVIHATPWHFAETENTDGITRMVTPAARLKNPPAPPIASQKGCCTNAGDTLGRRSLDMIEAPP